MQQMVVYSPRSADNQTGIAFQLLQLLKHGISADKQCGNNFGIFFQH